MRSPLRVRILAGEREFSAAYKLDSAAQHFIQASSRNRADRPSTRIARLPAEISEFFCYNAE